MAEHTPGPWETDYRGNINSHAPEFMADGEGPLWVGTYGVACQADGELIAAAPDLLAACEDLLALLDDMEPKTMTAADWDYAMQLLEDAVAKAKGGE